MKNGIASKVFACAALARARQSTCLGQPSAGVVVVDNPLAARLVEGTPFGKASADDGQYGHHQDAPVGECEMGCHGN